MNWSGDDGIELALESESRGFFERDQRRPRGFLRRLA
jgi:hypothetical protein